MNGDPTAIITTKCARFCRVRIDVRLVMQIMQPGRHEWRSYGDNYNEFALFCRVRIDAHLVMQIM